MRPRWLGHAGYARTSGGVLIRTGAAESWIGGREAFRLLRRLRPHLDGRAWVAHLTRHLDAAQARAVSGLLEHLVRIGAVDDLDVYSSPPPPADEPDPQHVAVPAVGGGGRLYDAVLADPLLPSLASGCPGLVMIHDVPNRRRDRRLHERAAGRGLAWLPVRADVNEVWIGPWSGSWPGCSTCLDLRRRAAHSFGHARERIARHLARWGEPNPLLRSGELARAVLELASAWDARDVPAVVRIPLGGGRPEMSALVPVPGCPVCGRFAPPRPRSDRLDLEEDAAGDRAETLASIAGRLDRFVPDRRTGIVCSAVCRPDESLPGVPLGRAWAPTQDLVRGRSLATEWALGSGDTPGEARTVAILEALERYAGGRPRGHDLELASAADLGTDALDPGLLVLHSDEQYRRPGFACAPFDPSARRYWIRAHSVREDRMLAVPADLAFYQMRTASPPSAAIVRPLAYNTSSGCAIAASAADASLRALLEVLERDALLVAWYGRRPLCRLNLETARDPRIGRLSEALRAEGYECLALDMTLPDVRVPSVWAIAVHAGDAGLKTLSGACSHPLHERAVLGAMREVASHLVLMRQHYDGQRRRSDRIAADPTLVRRPIDHALAYGNPRSFGRLEPLFGERSPATLLEHFAGAAPGPPLPSARWLGALCSRLIAGGLDVLLADVTPADVRELGLTVMRALVPGALPITFGHGHERLAGTTRAPAGADTLWPHPLA